MQRLGVVLVLLALAVIQLPWMTCHSDCQNVCGPLWTLFDHHCHADGAPHSHCWTHAHGPCGTHEEDEGSEDHEHGTGDHELSFFLASKTNAGPRLTRASASAELAPVPTPAEACGPDAATHVRVRPVVTATGPPERLATVRLLL